MRLPPEPFASTVDILTAAQHVETAIHTRTGAIAAAQLRLAAVQLDHASIYFKTYGKPNLSHITAMASNLLSSEAQYGSVLTGKSLATWQQDTLYTQVQGTLRWVFETVAHVRLG